MIYDTNFSALISMAGPSRSNRTEDGGLRPSMNEQVRDERPPRRDEPPGLPRDEWFLMKQDEGRLRKIEEFRRKEDAHRTAIEERRKRLADEENVCIKKY